MQLNKVLWTCSFIVTFLANINRPSWQIIFILSFRYKICVRKCFIPKNDIRFLTSLIWVRVCACRLSTTVGQAKQVNKNLICKSIYCCFPGKTVVLKRTRSAKLLSMGVDPLVRNWWKMKDKACLALRNLKWLMRFKTSNISSHYRRKSRKGRSSNEKDEYNGRV